LKTSGMYVGARLDVAS